MTIQDILVIAIAVLLTIGYFAIISLYYTIRARLKKEKYKPKE